MHHRDRDAHRKGFHTPPYITRYPRKLAPLLLSRVLPWTIAISALIFLIGELIK